jgi:hypothetical protein
MTNLDLSNIVNSGLSANRQISTASNVHPYVKGYFYVYFKFPTIVLNRITTGDNYSNDKLSNILLALCESYTPAGDRQIKYEDVIGLGDVGSSYITGQTIDRNFSLMFRDLWGSPILKIHRAWTSIIDPIFGGLVRNADDKDEIKFLPSTYKGSVIVIQTKPIAIYEEYTQNKLTAEDIVKVDLYTGVFPTTDLSSVYDANITDNSIVRPTITYRFDGAKYDESYDKTLVDTALQLLQSRIITQSNRYSPNPVNSINS